MRYPVLREILGTYRRETFPRAIVMITSKVSSGGRPAADQLPCRQYGSDLWFACAPAELQLAKVLCRSCPVIEQCLAGALSRQEPWGVWGGEIFDSGVVVAFKRGRGRPRKIDARPEPVVIAHDTTAPDAAA